jgi:hypothetical protein
MSWSLPNESLLKYTETPISKFDSISIPSHLVVGWSRTIISNGYPSIKSKIIEATLEMIVGSNSYDKVTCSFQSPYDAHIMFVAVCNTIIWLCEESYPILDNMPDTESPLPSRQGSILESRTLRNSVIHQAEINSKEIKTQIPHYYNHNNENETSEYNQNNNRLSAVQESITVNPNKKSALLTDHCRVRVMYAPEGEIIISMQHIKSSTVNALIAATEKGTVILFDLKIPRSYELGSWQSTKWISEPCNILSIWHARAPILGMSVCNVLVPTTTEEAEILKTGGRWRVAVWGFNNFIAILNLQL